MKKTILLFLFLFLVQESTFSQNTYEFMLRDAQNGTTGLNLIPLKNNTYVLGKTYYNLFTLRNGLDIIKIDILSNIYYSEKYKLDLGTLFTGKIANLIPTKDGGFALGSSYLHQQSTPNIDIHLAKFDSFGKYQWSNNYGTTAHREAASTVCQTADNGYIISGLTMAQNDGDAYCIKTDSLGEVQWTQYYGKEGFFDVSPTIAIDTVNGGGYIAGGSTKEKLVPEPRTAFILKLNEKGGSWMNLVEGNKNHLQS